MRPPSLETRELLEYDLAIEHAHLVEEIIAIAIGQDRPDLLKSVLDRITATPLRGVLANVRRPSLHEIEIYARAHAHISEAFARLAPLPDGESSAIDEADTSRRLGRIKQVLSEKRSGFIIEYGTEREWFFHRSSFEGAEWNLLAPGTNVTFEHGIDNDGRPCALQVRVG